jgi:hypothetical protein
MKHRALIYVMVAALLIVGLTACSKNKVEPPAMEGIQLPTSSTTIYSNFSLPAWLVYPPQGEYAIGLASKFANKKQPSVQTATDLAAMTGKIADFAYALDSLAVIHVADGFGNADEPEDFKISIVRDSTAALKEIKSYSTLSETALPGYKVYLLGNDKTQANQDIITVSASNAPSWSWEQKPRKDAEFTYTVGKSENANLIQAWYDARDAALKKLAQYRLDNSLAMIHKPNSRPEKKVVIGKVLDYIDPSYAKVWLYHKTIDGAPLYTVSVMLKTVN